MCWHISFCFFCFHETDYIVNQTYFATLVNFHVGGSNSCWDRGRVVIFSGIEDVGPATPKAFSLVRKWVVEIFTYRHSELSLAFRAHLIHEAATGDNASLRITVTHKVVFLSTVVIVDKRETTSSPRYFSEVIQIRVDLVLIIDRTAFDFFVFD